MTKVPDKIITHCKNCKVPLSARLLELINDPQSNNWVKEGYCSVICYRQQQDKQTKQSQPKIEIAKYEHPQKSKTDTINARGSFDHTSEKKHYNDAQIEKYSGQLLDTISLSERGKNKAYLIEYLQKEGGVSEMNIIKFILQITQLVKNEKLRYLNEIKRIISEETNDATAYEKIRELLKDNEVPHDLVEFVLYAACYSIDFGEKLRIEEKFKNRPNTVNYLLLFWGISWTFIGVFAILKYGVHAEILVALAMGIFCVIGGLSRKFRE